MKLVGESWRRRRWWWWTTILAHAPHKPCPLPAVNTAPSFDPPPHQGHAPSGEGGGGEGGLSLVPSPSSSSSFLRYFGQRHRLPPLPCQWLPPLPLAVVADGRVRAAERATPTTRRQPAQVLQQVPQQLLARTRGCSPGARPCPSSSSSSGASRPQALQPLAALDAAGHRLQVGGAIHHDPLLGLLELDRHKGGGGGDTHIVLTI